MKKHRMLAGGEWVEPLAGNWIESINPYTAKPWALIPRSSKEDVDRAVAAARAAFYGDAWRKLTATARGALLRRLGDMVATEADRLAGIKCTHNRKVLLRKSAQLHY